MGQVLVTTAVTGAWTSTELSCPPTPMPEVPRPRDIPWHCPYPEPLDLGKPLRRQVGLRIATPHGLQINKRWTCLDHRQVNQNLTDDLSQDAPKTIDIHDPQPHGGAEGHQGLELVAACQPIGSLAASGASMQARRPLSIWPGSSTVIVHHFRSKALWAL